LKILFSLFFIIIFKVIEKVGFTQVKAEDKTEMFIRVLQRELGELRGMKNDYIKVINSLKINKKQSATTSKRSCDPISPKLSCFVK